jgi:peptide/nickel transport system substrate-binding protein
LLLAGCRETTPTPRDVLVVALDTEPQTVDPRFGLDAGSSRLADLVHAGLTRADVDARRVPDLARSWEYRDATTLVFHLREDAHFWDGSPVTARDVQATYEALADPALGSPKQGALAPLAAIDAPAPDVVVMHLREPTPAFLDETGLAVHPAAEVRARTPPTGAGPFRLVESRAGDRLVLEPNPRFHDGTPAIRQLVLRIIPDPVVRVLLLDRGEVHFLQEALDPELLAWLEAKPHLTVTRRPGSSVLYLGLNLRSPVLGHRRVREAIALAIDRAALVRTVLGGFARPATGLLSPEHWAYAALPPRRPDPARARRLLDRAGFPDPDGAGPATRFRVVYKSSSQPSRRRLAEAIQAQVAAVGIGLDIRSYEWATLFADVRSGNFQMVAMAWGGINDPDFYRRAFHAGMRPPVGYNRGDYDDPVIDRLTNLARRTPDPARRRLLYRRVQRRLARELPVVPLWWEDRLVVHSTRLHDFTPMPSGDLRGLAGARFD